MSQKRRGVHRRSLLRGAVFSIPVTKLVFSGSAVTLAGLLLQACGGGGSGGGGAPAPGGGGPAPPPPIPTTTVGAATKKEGAVQTDDSWRSVFNGDLYTQVGPSGQQVNGDLNYGPWTPKAADNANVNVGSSVTWSVNGNGSGGPWTFSAT